MSFVIILVFLAVKTLLRVTIFSSLLKLIVFSIILKSQADICYLKVTQAFFVSNSFKPVLSH